MAAVAAPVDRFVAPPRQRPTTRDGRMSVMAIIWLLAFLAAQVQQPAAAADDAPTLRVASFNIRYGTADDGENRWERRKDFVFRTIQKLDPDLLGVQEALAFQVDELQAALPAYAFVGAGRDDGKRAGEFAGIYY